MKRNIKFKFFRKSKLPCNGLLGFPHMKKFYILSKRYIGYDTIDASDNTGQVVSEDADIHAIHAEFNKYYLNFVVATKSEVRVYEAQTGRLVKVLSEVVDTGRKCEIT
jgi:hypothetical protein